MGTPDGTTIVVPCFNEADRLVDEAFLYLASQDQLSLLMVDDGSSDATGDALDRLSRQSASIEVLHLETNWGKAEAVRRGLLRAIDRGADLVGYYDADGATPPDQLLRLVSTLRSDPDLMAVLGSRVARLGSDIHRSARRHYAGRIYATLASWALGIVVYDTQCGAKVFRSTPTLARSLAEPFPSRWTFDVWLLRRLTAGSDGSPPWHPDAFMEVPLDAWTDIAGSKMRISDAAVALKEIVEFALVGAKNHRSRPR